MPRAAYVANHNDEQLFKRLRRDLELAVKAHVQKREFIEKAARVFANGAEAASESGSSEREEQLLKKIGELTVERDFLARGLGRNR